jgi:hypothetical protein
MRWAYAALLLWATVAGCKADRTFACESSAECVRGGTQGQCLLPGFCAFSDSDCESGQRWDSSAASDRAEDCVPNGDPDPDESNECGGRTLLPGVVDGPCGICDGGLLACDGTDALTCTAEPDIEEILIPGGTRSSSVFNADPVTFGSGRAVDDDVTTSWFSAGVESDGASTFTWEGLQAECIGRIVVTGNSMHESPEFQTGYGFGSVTVRVIDGSSQVVFSEEVPLPDAQDDFELDIGVRGIDIELAFESPDDSDCGGFSEIDVYSLR